MSGSLDNYAIFKYTQDVHNDGLWNRYNTEARGIIFHVPTATIVCRPFSKFFNLDERPETKLEELPDPPFIIWEKLDGSCCSSFLYDGVLHMATPGSFESPQAIWATAFIKQKLKVSGKYDDFVEQNTIRTFIFEGLWPGSAGNPNPTVLDYKGKEALILLAVRNHNGTELSKPMVDTLAEEFGFERPKIYTDSILISRETRQQIPENEEGYVVQFLSNNLRVKVKGDWYTRIHRIHYALTIKGLCEALEANESMAFIKGLPKHIQRQADDYLAELWSKFYATKTAVQNVVEPIIGKERKEQASIILKELPRETAWLGFRLLDEQLYDKDIWKSVKNQLKLEDVNNE